MFRHIGQFAMRVVVAVVALLAAAANAGVLKESTNVPEHWMRTERSPRDLMIELTVAVKLQNTDVLHETLMTVSDPASAAYGQHLTTNQVSDLVKPELSSVVAVLSWLDAAGVDTSTVEATRTGDFISVVVPVATAEQLLETEYHAFVHRDTGDVVHRAHGGYRLPAEVAPHVDTVGPASRFPAVRRLRVDVAGSKRSPSMRALQQFGQVTPASLRKLYNVGDVQAKESSNLQAVAQFLGQYYSPSDLESFFEQYYTPAKGRAVHRVIGPNDASNPGIEASLDIEYVMAMGANVSTWFWSTAGQQPHSPQNEPFLKFLQLLANSTTFPYVISTSYGDNEDTVNFDYAVRVNDEFKRAGVRGISLLYSSGDGGVSGGQSGSCTNFVPTFPAGSPYVTAVGGTTGSSPETAASLSSGGFSNYWSRPTYQESFVQTYLKTASNLPDASRFNHTGNGFPDVSAQAQGFMIVYDGFPSPVDGTSCSSPTFAGIVSLLNDLRIAAGKSPLGFLNPLFYQNPDAFNDITSGNNPGCGTDGFYAAKGWDPVTGLGSPDYQKLANIVSQLA